MSIQIEFATRPHLLWRQDRFPLRLALLYFGLRVGHLIGRRAAEECKGEGQAGQASRVGEVSWSRGGGGGESSWGGRSEGGVECTGEGGWDPGHAECDEEWEE